MTDKQALFAADERLLKGIKRVDLGYVHVPTGHVFCCDPFLSHECAALDRSVPSGDFLVSLNLLTVAEWGERVGFAAMFVSHAPVADWEEATYRSDGKVFSKFLVDAGLACFMDASVESLFCATVGEFYRQHPDGNYYNDILASGFLEHAQFPGHSGDWLLHFPLPHDPSNVAMFASGLGDGVYQSYWGLDERGQPCRLMVDFGISE